MKKTSSVIIAILLMFQLCAQSVLTANASIYDGAPRQEIVYTQSHVSAWDSVYTNNWYNQTYGKPGNSSYAEAACGILSVVNAVHYLTGKFIDPLWLGDWSTSHGYRPYQSGTSWGFITNFPQECGSDYGFSYVLTMNGKSANYWTRMREYLSNGMVAVAVTTTIANGRGHFMAIVDYNPATDQFLLLDCAPSNNRATSTKGIRWATAAQLEEKSIYRETAIYKGESIATRVILSMDRTEVGMGETFTLSMSADAVSPYYWLSIHRYGTDDHYGEDEEIISQPVYGDSFSTSFLSCGHYYAWCSSSNGVDSNFVDFYVYGGEPTTVTITPSASEVKLYETINFTLSTDAYYTRYYVSIYDPNGDQCFGAETDGRFEFIPTMPGTYTYHAAAFTSQTNLASSWGSFTVLDELPDFYGEATLTIENPEVRIDEPFTIHCETDLPASYYISVYNVNTSDCVIGRWVDNGVYTDSFKAAGHYTAHMTAVYDAGGQQDSNWIDFYVFGPAPTTADNAVDKQTIVLGDSVTITTTHNAYYARIYTTIYCNNEDVPYCEGWRESSFQITPTRCGHYTVNTSAYTIDGTAHAGWSSFDVICDSHQWDNGEVTVLATATADGVMMYTCTVCGATKTELIPKTEPEALAVANVTRAPTSFIASGEQQQPAVTVKNAAGETLTEGVDYRVTYPVSIERGSYLVRVDGINNYKGTVRKAYVIREPLAAANVSRSPTVFYANGKQQQPTVTVVNADGVTLTKGTDYTVTYPTSIEPGSYMVRVDGKGLYAGTVRKAYTIKAVEALDAARVTRTPISFTANGAQQQPTVKVTNAAGKTLTEGTDYKVTYPVSVEPGSYMVRVDGINGYKGTVRKAYTVKEALTVAGVTRTPTTFIANGQQQQPTVTVKNAAGETLTEGVDYKVTYPESIEPGSYLVRVEGKGLYTGTIRKAYTIK